MAGLTKPAINDNNSPAHRARARLSKLLGEPAETTPAPAKTAEG